MSTRPRQEPLQLRAIYTGIRRVTWRRFPTMPIADLIRAGPLQGNGSGPYRLPPAIPTMCTCDINKMLIYLAIHGQLCGEWSFKGGEREPGEGSGQGGAGDQQGRRRHRGRRAMG